MITGLYSTLTIVLSIVAVLGPVGTIAAMFFAPAIAGPVIASVWSRFINCTYCVIAVSFVVASVVSFWIGHHEAYQSGVDDTVAKVARGDAKLVDRARKARSKLLDCQAQGKAWSQSTGDCR